MRASILVLFLAIAVSATAQSHPLAYSTYFGGNGFDNVNAATSDRFGFVYLAGYTNSADFPTTPGAYLTSRPTTCGSAPCNGYFISKLRTDGAGLVFSTFLPGQPVAIALDPSDNIYVAGPLLENEYQNFPVTPGAISNPSGRLFIAKISADGSKLLYAARLGSGNSERIKSIAVDPAGELYATGWSYSTQFPVTNGAYQTAGPGAFLFRVSADASRFIYAAWLGGLDSANEGRYGTQPYAIALDAAGNAFVTGPTDSMSFPVTSNALQTQRPANGPANFLLKLSADGSTLLYSTYFSRAPITSNTNGNDLPYALAVDDQGMVYMGGASLIDIYGHPYVPVTSSVFQKRIATPYVTKYNLAPAAFVAKFDTSRIGSASLVWSTLLAAPDSFVRGIGVDANHRVYLTGGAAAQPFTANRIQPCGGVFVSELSSDAHTLLFSTPFISIDRTNWVSTAIVGMGLNTVPDVFVAGNTSSLKYVTTPGAMRTADTDTQAAPNGQDGFVFKLDGTQLTVGTSGTGLNICNATLQGSEFVLNANAIGTGRVAYMRIYIDGVKKYEFAGVNSVNDGYLLPEGMHKVTVQVVETSGKTYSKSYSFNVPPR